jgi:tetratricopeptide (TPR) repeat protein
MKGISNRKYFLFFFFILLVSISFSQQSVGTTTAFAEYNEALNLYNNKVYAAAQKKFKKVATHNNLGNNLKLDAQYYDAMSAIRLNQAEADKKMLSFIEENPNSSKKNRAFFDIANYYFANTKAAYALKWYKKVDIQKISNDDLKELNYKMGYCFLVTKNYILAKDKFIQLINDAKYGNDSRYYYGYIAYKLEDYGLAESTLKEIESNETYRLEISYYLLDINFKVGNFEKCIIIGTELLETAKRNQRSDINKIIGESYFNVEKYAEAIPYLKAYKGKKGKWINTDYYQLGYAYYKQEDYKTAITYFNKIIDEKNKVAQNAYSHLGECYLKIDQKIEALNAFRSASEMTFNLKIKQDAALNYAKLSYDAGNPFESVAVVLKRFLKTYPKSASYKEINKLLVSSYIHQQDYVGALQFLSEEKKTQENKELIFEVSLYRGIQLFNEKSIEKALPFFATAINSQDKKVNQKAAYWQAETNYVLENFDAALPQFVALQNNIAKTNTKIDTSKSDNVFLLLDYNIGYCYFKLKEYEKAIPYFSRFSSVDFYLAEKLIDDSTVRLGDCYFALANYEDAIATYKKVIANFGNGSDYAAYQTGIIYGIIHSPYAKIESLKTVVNKYSVTSLKDDALFQIANTYTSVKDTKNAHIAYNKLLEEYPASVFIPKALVRQGLLYYNNNENDKALEKFKETARRFPNSPDSYEAVANARNIYIDKGDLDDYVKWLKKLDFITFNNSDIDNTTFELAEKTYFESKVGEEIINNLYEYIRKFPKGIHRIKANYYLADVYFKVKEYEKAAPYYEFIIDEDLNEYTEESLVNLSEIYLKENKFESALPLLDRLEQEAYEAENVLFAKSNLMRGYYETEAYELAIEYGRKILLIGKLNTELENDVKKIIARSSFKIEDFINAEDYYADIEETAKGELKAEVLYHLAFFKREFEDYEESNKIVQDLIANYSSYKYWAVKSYVLMGKNYASIDDIYQATFVLENVIKNFPQFEDIAIEAEEALINIKAKEAKKNGSIKSNEDN